MKKFRLGFILILIFVFVTQIGTSNQTGTVSKKNPDVNQEIIADRNVNMVSGTQLPYGDPWLQRQNEPSIAVSTRNTLHLLAGANDYRTIDIPGKEGDELPGQEEGETAQAPREPWLGVFKSFDGGQSWITSLHPGYPQDYSQDGIDFRAKISSAGLNPILVTAAADPVVRAGTNGLFYFCGIAFDRNTKQGVLFVSRFIDNNNLEKNDVGQDCIKYLDTQIIAVGVGGEFIDKPWMAVDKPNNMGTVVIDGQTIPKANIYVAYSVFRTGTDGTLVSEIRFVRSVDCGETDPWESSFRIEGDAASILGKGNKTVEGINQGATIGIDPTDGTVYVAWRCFGNDSKSDAMFVTGSNNSGAYGSFSVPELVADKIGPFDQGSSIATFRTNSYPAIAVDDSGYVYLAWSERQGKDRSHIVLSVHDGKKWSSAKKIDNSGEGHQLMPSMTYANGKIVVAWYDQRNDFSQRFTEYIDDISGEPRHTLDVRVAQASPGKNPNFESSKQVSRYPFILTGTRGNYSAKQARFNVVNYPLFKSGTWPFMGDYIDIAPSPMFVLDESGEWQFNTQPSDSATYHAAWTDNRDVRPPVAGSGNNWTNYAPPVSTQEYPFNQTNSCANWTNAGMRNQNIYTSRITQGIIVGSPGNTKPLGTLVDTQDGKDIPRAFVVFVKNTTDLTKSFRLTIANQPPDEPTEDEPDGAGRASFLEFEELYSLDMQVAPRSSISRSVFVYSTVEDASIQVNVAEIDAPYGGIIPEGLKSAVILNPDIMNPDIMNPDIMNPDIMNYEIHNPDIMNPDIMNWYVNPDIMNPDIMNPDIMNPDIMNPDIMNPDIMNPDIMNPDIMNPDIMNPDIMNPDIMNPSIDDPLAGQFTDVAWMVQNIGNTSSSYTFKTLSTAAREDGTLPEGIQAQLLIYQIYKTPNEYNGPGSCELGLQEHHDLVLNVVNPDIMNPDIMNIDFLNPDIMNPDIMNATFSLAPGGEAKVILRLWKPNQSGVVTTTTGKILNFNDPNSIMDNFGIHVSGTARNTDDLEKGITSYPDDSSLFMIDTKILKPGEVNQLYVDFLSASGGKKPYSWAVLDNLPSGLILDPATGRVYGTPTAPGTFSFEAKVTDAELKISTKKVWIIIFPAIGGYTVTGRVVTSAGTGIKGVELTGLPGMSGTGDPVITDDVGYYTGFVSSGWSGTVTPAKPGYTFVPTSRSYSNVTSDQAVQNYTATPLFGVLDHFDISAISSPQTAGTAFNITITAKDSNENVVTSYSDINTLELNSTKAISPEFTGAFENGVWSGDVNITHALTGVKIITSGDGVTSESDEFEVGPAEASFFAFGPNIINPNIPNPDMIAGVSRDIKVVTYDEYFNVATGYTGAQSLIFSGANPSPNPVTNPTCQGIDFLSATEVTFSDGISEIITMTLYMAEIVSINVTDNTIFTTQSYDVAVSPAPLDHINIVDASGEGASEIGNHTMTTDDTLELWSAGYDMYGNFRENLPVSWSCTGTLDPLPTSPVENFTFSPTTAPTSGTIEADYMGAHTDATGIITVNPGALASFIVDAPDTGTVGVPFTVTVTAKDSEGNTTTSVSETTTLSVNPGSISPGSISAAEFAANGTWTDDVTISGSGSNALTIYATNNGKTGSDTINIYLQPTVQFSTASSDGDEWTTPANLQVELSGTAALSVTVNYAVTGGTATGGGTDFMLASGAATITQGNTTTNIPITINDDGIDEVNETIEVTISSPTNATLGSVTEHIYTILDNDATPTISFVSNPYSHGENAGTPDTIQVTLNGQSESTVSVRLSTSDGTATAGVDYEANSMDLVWDPMETGEKSLFQVTLIDDFIDEENETILLRLTDEVNCTISGDNPTTLTILDDDVVISGTILMPGWSPEPDHPVSGVVMYGLPGNPVTDASGNYSAVVPVGWSGTVTPAKSHYLFYMPSLTYSGVTENVANQDYNGYFKIYGTVTYNSSGLSGVAFTGFPSTPFPSAVTNASGYYEGAVPWLWRGTIIPSKAGYVFSPQQLPFHDQTSPEEANFVAATELQITTTTPLQDGVLDVPYSETLSATGGTPPYTWSMASGSLPTGLSLSSSGVISGTPGSTGPFTFRVFVQDSAQQQAGKELDITINPPPHTVSAPAIAIAGGTNRQPNYTVFYGPSVCSWGHVVVEHQIDYGDGNQSPWFSGYYYDAYTYSTPGTYQVKARGKCTDDTGVVSAWSSEITHTVNPIISGQVFEWIEWPGGYYKQGKSGVTIYFSGGAGTATTGIVGHYTKEVNENWTGTVVPSDVYNYSTTYRTYANVTTDTTIQDYIASATRNIYFTNQPGSNKHGAQITVQVKVQVDDGSPLPGYFGTLNIGANPGGVYFSTKNFLTNESGIATISFSIDSSGVGYTVVAAAAGKSVSSLPFDIY